MILSLTQQNKKGVIGGAMGIKKNNGLKVLGSSGRNIIGTEIFEHIRRKPIIVGLYFLLR